MVCLTDKFTAVQDAVFALVGRNKCRIHCVLADSCNCETGVTDLQQNLLWSMDHYFILTLKLVIFVVLCMLRLEGRVSAIVLIIHHSYVHKLQEQKQD